MSGPLLEVLSGELAGKAYQVDDQEFVIGRAPNCHLVIPKRYISREHARILREEDQFVVDSLSAKNPVRVRDKAVREHVLADGDEFEVCGIRFRFRQVGELARRRHAHVEMPGSAGSAEDHRGEARTRAGASAPTPDPDAGNANRRSRAADPPTPDPDTSDVPRRSAREEEPRRQSAAAGATRKSAADARSAAGKVVFEVDDKTSEDEQTAAVPGPAKGSAKASAKGSAEDVRERTAEMGKVDDPDDPDYDPFANVEGTKGKKKEADPARERLLKMLTWLGLLSIAGAGGILWKFNQPGEWKTQQFNPDTPVVVRLDESVMFTVDWTPDDPPAGRGTEFSTYSTGETQTIYSDPFVNVDWVVPHVDAKSYFMVTGKDAGDTRMELRFEGSRRVLLIDIQVQNDSIHENGRQRRREALLKEHQDPEQLRILCEQHTASGEKFTNERAVPGKETYYRLGLVEFQKATDAAVACRTLLAKVGTVPADDTQRVQQCDERESRAKKEYEEYYLRQMALYRDSLSLDWTAKTRALRQALRAINHECDPDYQRLKLLMEEAWKGKVDADGTEKCELR